MIFFKMGARYIVCVSTTRGVGLASGYTTTLIIIIIYIEINTHFNHTHAHTLIIEEQ